MGGGSQNRTIPDPLDFPSQQEESEMIGFDTDILITF